VTALVLPACGGPLEEEELQATESQQQAVDNGTMANISNGNGYVQSLPTVRDRIMKQPILRNEQRWYAPGAPE
jgi:hypothetical protein